VTVRRVFSTLPLCALVLAAPGVPAHAAEPPLIPRFVEETDSAASTQAAVTAAALTSAET
jgi:hypothetical protein